MSHVLKVRILYKSILRLHRGMPPALQELGTNYTRDEFKRHKNLKVDAPETHIFMMEWTDYALNLAKQLILKGSAPELGKSLDETQLDVFRDEQINQLHELLLAAKGEGDSGPENTTKNN
ncbi:unnamed protein product [Diamesa serratosioi]